MSLDTSDKRRSLATTAYQTEVCECGHKRSEHSDLHATGIPTTLGHGGIPKVCLRYTWDGTSGPFAVTE